MMEKIVGSKTARRIIRKFVFLSSSMIFFPEIIQLKNFEINSKCVNIIRQILTDHSVFRRSQ